MYEELNPDRLHHFSAILEQFLMSLTLVAGAKDTK
jgi:hypothetical protein